MANISDFNYEKIDNPYNKNLERADAITPTTIPMSMSINSPSDMAQGVISGQSFSDIYISNFIKSRNYKPKVSGFLLDGKKGYIEANELYIGVGGIIGGLIDIPDATSANSWHVDATGNMWSGCNSADFALNQDNANAYILNTGTAQFKSITILGGTITGGIIQTSASGERIVLSENDLVSYNQYNDQECKINATLSVLDLNVYSGRTGLSASYINPSIHSLINLLDEVSTEESSGILFNAKRSSTADGNETIVNIENEGGNGISMAINGHNALANVALDLTALDLDKSGVLFTDNINSVANNDSLMEILCEDNASELNACLLLGTNTTNNVAHLRLIGDPDPVAPADGSIWFDGSDLKIMIGATIYAFDKTAV